jgi:hypothetical protein
VRASLFSIALLCCCALICGGASGERPPQWTQYRTRWPVELPCRHFTQVAASNGSPVYAEWRSADGRSTLEIQQNGTRIPPALDVTRLTELRALSPAPVGEISIELSCPEPADPDFDLETPGISWRCQGNVCYSTVTYSAPRLRERWLMALGDARRSIGPDGQDDRRREQTIERLTRALLDSAGQMLQSICRSHRCSEAAGPLRARLAMLRGSLGGTITSSSADVHEGSFRAALQVKQCALRLACATPEQRERSVCEVDISGCGSAVQLYQNQEEAEIWLCEGPKDDSGCWGQSLSYGPATWIGGSVLRSRPLP